ncbi:hypothetical protein [Chitinophaga caseinilytica]|uniref:Uncharacterized protein n=1 Tax=Chitinophaga caseinilytica TaxID=2267521 RepID=A0ABZ2Z9L0_9BACT
MFVPSQKLYTAEPGLIIGFHGCDQFVRDAVASGRDVLWKSENEYDWLGHGYYFWQNNFERAFEFASHPPGKPVSERPAVLGAVLSLGNCLDLTDKKCIKVVEDIYREFSLTRFIEDKTLSTNKSIGASPDLLLRNLDCEVLEFLHAKMKRENVPPYDSVRGVFVEGKPIFEGAGIYDKTHAQICIRNPNCILGYFVPRERVAWP